MVVASRPVLSARRLAARPVGAQSAISAPLAAQDLQDGVDQGGLAHARAAGDDQHLRGERQAHRRPLALGQGQAGLALDPGDGLLGVDRRPGRRADGEAPQPLGDVPLGPVEAGQEDAALPLQRVGDHVAGLELQAEGGLDQLAGTSSRLSARSSSSASGRPQWPCSMASASAKEMPARTRIMAVLLDAEPGGDLVGGAEADAADVAREPVGVLADQAHGLGAVGLVDPHRPRGADPVSSAGTA